MSLVIFVVLRYYLRQTELWNHSFSQDQKEECKQLTTNACDRTESDSDPEFGFQRGVALPGEKPPDQPET